MLVGHLMLEALDRRSTRWMLEVVGEFFFPQKINLVGVGGVYHGMTVK